MHTHIHPITYTYKHMHILICIIHIWYAIFIKKVLKEKQYRRIDIDKSNVTHSNNKVTMELRLQDETFIVPRRHETKHYLIIMINNLPNKVLLLLHELLRFYLYDN